MDTAKQLNFLDYAGGCEGDKEVDFEFNRLLFNPSRGFEVQSLILLYENSLCCSSTLTPISFFSARSSTLSTTAPMCDMPA